jgi:hypothetical protein
MALGEYRGVYNSAWVGVMTAVLTSIFLTLAGFYLVKDTIERDERTGVGQILAATPLSKPLYIAGKALSNFAVLAAMAGVLALAALAMQLVRGEDTRLDLWALWSPFVFSALPALALTAAAAVLFETIGWLRGGFGNFVYFFGWMALLVAGTIVPAQGPAASGGRDDVFGLNVPLAHITAAARAAFPDYDGTVTIGFTIAEAGGPGLRTFTWEGMAWTPAQAAARLAWVGAAAGLALIAAVLFNRFDSGNVRAPARAEAGGQPGEASAADEVERPQAGGPRLRPNRGAAARGEAGDQAGEASAADGGIKPRRGGRRLRPYGGAFTAEVKLLLKGRPWWWYAGALALVAAGTVTAPETARGIVLPLAWLWPALVWSGMGGREARFGTGALVFSAPRPVARQLPAAWLAGVAVAAAAGSGVLVGLARGGDLAGVLGWLAGAAFIPALALALGAWSGGSKLFEVVYALWWYAGPLNGVPGLDFAGARQGGLWPAYLALAVGLLALAAAGRWWQARGA